MKICRTTSYHIDKVQIFGSFKHKMHKDIFILRKKTLSGDGRKCFISFSNKTITAKFYIIGDSSLYQMRRENVKI